MKQRWQRTTTNRKTETPESEIKTIKAIKKQQLHMKYKSNKSKGNEKQQRIEWLTKERITHRLSLIFDLYPLLRDRAQRLNPSGSKNTSGSIRPESETWSGSRGWIFTRTAAGQSQSCWRWRPAPPLPFRGNNRIVQVCIYQPSKL